MRTVLRQLTCFLGYASLLISPGGVLAASGTLEVDLVFPHNDTYAPAYIVPIVFAFHNPELAAYLEPELSYSIIPYGNYTRDYASEYWTPDNFNFSSNDPYLKYGAAFEVLQEEDTWMLTWTLGFNSCRGEPGSLDPIRDSEKRRVVFTTKKGAKKPDFSEMTGNKDSCSRNQGRAFSIVGIHDSGNYAQNPVTCASFAETTPTATLCEAEIAASEVSSVSSVLTRAACLFETATWCPQPVDDDGAAGRLEVPSLAVGGVAFMATALGGIGFLFM